MFTPFSFGRFTNFLFLLSFSCMILLFFCNTFSFSSSLSFFPFSHFTLILITFSNSPFFLLIYFIFLFSQGTQLNKKFDALISYPLRRLYHFPTFYKLFWNPQLHLSIQYSNLIFLILILSLFYCLVLSPMLFQLVNLLY